MIVQQPVQRFATLVIVEKTIDLIHDDIRTRI